MACSFHSFLDRRIDASDGDGDVHDDYDDDDDANRDGDVGDVGDVGDDDDGDDDAIKRAPILGYRPCGPTASPGQLSEPVSQH